MNRCRTELRDARKRIAELESMCAKKDEALKQYISHDEDCAEVVHPSLSAQCDCRFAAVLSALIPSIRSGERGR